MLHSESGRRQFLFERDGHRCRFCGRVGEDHDLVVTRVGVLAGGVVGSDHELVTSCRACAGHATWVRSRNDLEKREQWTPVDRSRSRGGRL